jgi:DNA repair protein RecO (recombination protein O)
MLQKISGIVLRVVNYKDSKCVVDLFTDVIGRASFIANMSRGKKTVSRNTLWMPLSQVDFFANMHGLSRLPQVKNATLATVYTDLPFNHIKQSVVMFLQELLGAALRQEGPNMPLFSFVSYSFQWFDKASNPTSVANFHIVFLLRLLRFVGIEPNLDAPSLYFDMVNAEYVDKKPFHGHFLEGEHAKILPLLFRLNFSNMHLLRLEREQRRDILDGIISFYRLHIPAFSELRSLDVLKSVFD